MRKKRNSTAIVLALLLVLAAGIYFITHISDDETSGSSKTESSGQTSAAASAVTPVPTPILISTPVPVPTAAAVPPADTAANAYILPQSSTEFLTEDDLRGLSAFDLKIARNEIFARHGRKFKDPELQNYFDMQPWYHGTIEPDDFDNKSLSLIEDTNAKLIRSYEHKMGYNGQ